MENIINTTGGRKREGKIFIKIKNIEIKLNINKYLNMSGQNNVVD